MLHNHNLRCHLIAAPGFGAGADPGILFALGHGDDLDDTAWPRHGGEPLGLKGGYEDLVGRRLRNGFGRYDRHLSLDSWIHQEVTSRHLRHGLNHGLDIRGLEIK